MTDIPANRKVPAVGPENSRKAIKVRLPVFVRDEDIGLGDVLKRATSAVGIKPCDGCEKRAAALNNFVRFTR
jgi:hypothetical protein